MKIVYMGTPDFAVAALEKLIEKGHEILLVVTQPDKPVGRGKEVKKSPVKEAALLHGIEVFQPEKIRLDENVEYLKGYDADICIVAAFGQILSEEILRLWKYGCINIHASLLPHLRGAAPIQWSILDGDEKTGITIQQMSKGLDTGDILYQKEICIDSEDTADSLFDKLMYLGADMAVEVIELLEKGKITPIAQKEEEASYAKKITKELGLIDFEDDVEKIERYVRGLNSWPSAYTFFEGKMLKIWKSSVDKKDIKSDSPVKFGEVVEVTKDSFSVKCRGGLLVIHEVQLSGKKRMTVHDFLLGTDIRKGTVLGEVIG